MRSITFGYPDLATLALDLQGDDPELPLPSGQRGAAGEWVLAVFKVDDSTATSAAAARIEEREGGLAMTFEARDWSRLSSELLGLPAPMAGPKSVRSKRAPVSKRGGAASSSKSAPRSKRSPTTATLPPPAPASSGASSKGRSRTVVPKASPSTPPMSQRGATVLTRTLVPPPAPEIHEADAPDRTLEAPIDPASWRVQPSSSKPSKPSIPRLLLVEDDPDMQVMIREMLDAIGLQVECVAEGEQALDRVVLGRFDLVVLDWNLPGMSGLELCREIRRHPRVGSTPVLFLTGKSGSRDLVDAFAAGADDFVAKPFRAPELGARLLALLRRAKIGLSVPPSAE